MGDAHGKVSGPIFDFVHFVDDVGPKKYDFSEVKTEELKSEIEKLKSKGNVKQKYNCKLNKKYEQERKQVIRKQENLQNNATMISMKMENLS